MPVPAWVIEYTVFLILGLIAGLLVRFILVVIAVLAAIVLLVWLLGYVDSSLFSSLPSLTSRFLGGLPIGPQVLLTVGALVFLVGLFLGLLLTTRVRVLDRARAA
jgi:hypothetical protein